MARSTLIGNLAVNLAMETAAFEKGAKNAAATTGRLEGFMGKASKAAGAFGAALVGSGVIVGLKELVSQGLAHASALGEQAQQLGVSTKALQEYRYAATQVGLSQDEMDSALAKLTRTMGEAAAGAKAPAQAFEQLGIDIEAFVASGKDAGELIPLIAEGLKGIATPAERAALLVDLFGRAGQKLAPLLAEGSEGVNKLREDAKRLGLVMSDEMIKKADDAADKLAALETVMKARLAVAVADNADKILELANRMEQLAFKAQKVWEWLNKLADSKIGKALFFLSDKAGYLNPVTLVGRALGTGATAIPAGSARSGGSTAPIGLRDLPRSAPNWQAGTLKPGIFSSNLAPTRPGFAPGAGVAGGFEAIGGPAAGIMRAIAGIEAANEKAAEQTEENNERITMSFRDMARDVTSSLSNLAGSIRSGGFLDIFGSIVDLLLQLGSIGVFGKGLQTNINTARFGGARAMGGPVVSGKSYLVGERGPEWFTPGAGGRISPMNDNGSVVTIVPTPYFDAVVDGRAQKVAAPMAMASGHYARSAAQGDMRKRARRRIPG